MRSANAGGDDGVSLRLARPTFAILWPGHRGSRAREREPVLRIPIDSDVADSIQTGIVRTRCAQQAIWWSKWRLTPVELAEAGRCSAHVNNRARGLMNASLRRKLAEESPGGRDDWIGVRGCGPWRARPLTPRAWLVGATPDTCPRRAVSPCDGPCGHFPWLLLDGD